MGLKNPFAMKDCQQEALASCVSEGVGLSIEVVKLKKEGTNNEC